MTASIRGEIVAIRSPRLISTLARLREGLSRDGWAAALEEIGRRVSRIDWLPYPAPTGAAMSDLWTDKQRRYFWAAYKRGDIKLPYKRTRGLGRAVKVAVDVLGYEANIDIFIDPSSPAAKYAKWVLGIEQSRYFEHRTNWDVFPVMVAKKEQEVTNAIVVVASDLMESLRIG